MAVSPYPTDGEKPWKPGNVEAGMDTEGAPRNSGQLSREESSASGDSGDRARLPALRGALAPRREGT